MRRGRRDSDHDDDYADDTPLHHKRAFGSGLKRKKVEFVRAEQPDNSIATINKPQSSGSAVGDLYASVVLGSGTPSSDKLPETAADSEPDATASTAGTAQPAAQEICAVCSLPITTTIEKHEASLAHQVSLAHSHPPSALDRKRMGLRALASHGWDPDARIGLGREGEGLRYPIKVTAKEDLLGVGATITEKTEAEKKKEQEEKEAKRQLTTKERKALAVKERQKAEKLQAEIYGRVDVDKYLKGSGKEWE
ncbi:hypothetical protein K4F52_009060 [Lecanicillium sp. MT-2017a]|nr:hypothetical protein K4F52_009060 [Lecanicillium sp. MT-2017a]